MCPTQFKYGKGGNRAGCNDCSPWHKLPQMLFCRSMCHGGRVETEGPVRAYCRCVCPPAPPTDSHRSSSFLQPWPAHNDSHTTQPCQPASKQLKHPYCHTKPHWASPAHMHPAASPAASLKSVRMCCMFDTLPMCLGPFPGLPAWQPTGRAPACLT